MDKLRVQVASHGSCIRETSDLTQIFQWPDPRLCFCHLVPLVSAYVLSLALYFCNRFWQWYNYFLNKFLLFLWWVRVNFYSLFLQLKTLLCSPQIIINNGSHLQVHARYRQGTSTSYRWYLILTTILGGIIIFLILQIRLREAFVNNAAVNILVYISLAFLHTHFCWV